MPRASSSALRRRDDAESARYQRRPRRRCLARLVDPAPCGPRNALRIPRAWTKSPQRTPPLSPRLASTCSTPAVAHGASAGAGHPSGVHWETTARRPSLAGHRDLRIARQRPQRLHPGSRAPAGKHLGLTAAPAIEHQKLIGVTAVELLPCQAFMSEPFLREGVRPTIGATTLCAGLRRRTNSRWMTRWSIQDHDEGPARAGIEVILDMVSTTPPRGTRMARCRSEGTRQLALLSAARRESLRRKRYRVRQHGRLRASA